MPAARIEAARERLSQADTTQVLLTPDALTRMASFWTTFLQEPPAIRDTARYQTQARLSLVWGSGPQSRFHTVAVDWLTLAVQYPSVAEDFKRVGLTPEAWRQLRRSLFTATLIDRMTQGAPQSEMQAAKPDPRSVAWQNVEFLRTHPKELDALVARGFTLPKPEKQ